MRRAANGIADAEAHAVRAALACEATAREMLADEKSHAEKVGRLNRFSPTEALRAVRSALAPIRAEDLMSIRRTEIGEIESAELPGRTLIFAGGAIPEPAVRSVAAAAMVSREVTLRPSARDPWLAAEFARRLDARLAGSVRITVETWPRESAERTLAAVSAADSFVLFGTGRAVERLTGLARPDCRVFANGPRLSFVVVDANLTQDLGAAAEGIAEDMFAYDQLGCLSPSALYCVGGDPGSLVVLREALAGALDARADAQGWSPRISAGAAAEIRALRAIHSMDPSGMKSVRTANPPPEVPHPGWTLLTDLADPALLPSPGYQTLRLHRLDARDQLPGAIGEQPVQCMGLAPEGCLAPDAVIKRLEANGLSRVCAAGRMQSPPLGWLHDGNPFFPVRA